MSQMGLREISGQKFKVDFAKQGRPLACSHSAEESGGRAADLQDAPVGGSVLEDDVCGTRPGSQTPHPTSLHSEQPREATL